MAKNDVIKFRWAHLVLILLGIFGSGVAAWVWQQAETKAIAKEVAELTEEVSEPVKRHDQKIGIIEYRLNSIDKKQAAFAVEQKEMRTENVAAFKAIMDKLNDK